MLDAVPSPACEAEPDLPGWGRLLEECGGSSVEGGSQVEGGAHECPDEGGAEEHFVFADVLQHHRLGRPTLSGTVCGL